MADKIVVDLTYVDDLKTKVTSSKNDLSSSSPSGVSIDSDAKMQDKLHDFMERWDKRRGELADSLAAVEQALTAIHEAFDGTECELVSQLGGGGP